MGRREEGVGLRRQKEKSETLTRDVLPGDLGLGPERSREEGKED